MNKQAERRPGGAETAPFWAWLLLCGLLVAGTAYLRLVVFPDRLVPLAYGLPLLVFLWHRDRRLLYGMALIFSGLALTKVFFVVPEERYESWYDWSAAFMVLLNIWLVAGVLHGIAWTLERIEERNAQIEAANAELEASNEELAAREEEITRQNEELQSQTEELEQQSEELRQQTEESEQQAVELQATNEELVRQEKGLRILLGSARWLQSDVSEEEVTSAICHAAVQLMEEAGDAAAIVEEQGGRLWIRGHWGFGVHGTFKEERDFNRSFAALIVESQRTAYIKDVAARPELEMPQPLVGRPFRSILATPIWSEGRPFGALEVFAHEPREWTEDDFAMIEWLGAQAALALRTVQYQRELELKRREAEEASLQKTRFLAAVSHDVRTPANAISLMADLIEQTAGTPDLADEMPKLASDLKDNARSLVELVSDVLDLARFDAGKLDLQVNEFPLCTFVEAELRQFRAGVKAKGIRLSTLLPEAPLWIRTDKMKLARVLSNLVGNAVKFTDSGEVQVQVERRGDTAELAVRDTGPGISPEHLSHIFEEFHQLRNPERDRSKGTGLGLAICRRLVDALGCSISVESTLGAGSTFAIRLPPEMVIDRQPESSSAATASSFAADSPPRISSLADTPRVPSPSLDGNHDKACALDGLRILLVEDHDSTRITTAQLLAACGAAVFQANDAAAAMSALAHEDPHVLLLDLMLPDRDGTDVLRQLRQRERGSLRCILAVSGDVRPERVDEVKRLGADGMLPKPLNLNTLLSALRRHLSPAETTAVADQRLEPTLDGDGAGV